MLDKENLLLFTPPAAVSGWFRLGIHLRWHFMSAWEHHRGILIPECKRQIAVRVGAKLVAKGDLPVAALLCMGCAASPEARAV